MPDIDRQAVEALALLDQLGFKPGAVAWVESLQEFPLLEAYRILGLPYHSLLVLWAQSYSFTHRTSVVSNFLSSERLLSAF